MNNNGSKGVRMAQVCGCVLLLTAVNWCTAAAQTRQQPQIKPPTTSSSTSDTVPGPSVLVDADQDYRIGPRDVIEIKVDDAEELSKIYEIRADGTFLMNHLNRVKASGMSPDELARFIENGLRGSYLKEPHVAVVVKQFNSHTFIIQGSVSKPGVYQIEGRPSLFKLISVAGGLSEIHGTTAYIIRENKTKKATDAASEQGKSLVRPLDPTKTESSVQTGEDPTEYTVIPAKIAGLLRGVMNNNPILEPGDTVSIPKADVFYVEGEVNGPGSFPLSDGITLRQAIALSQGTTSNAKGSDSTIMRTNDDGSLHEIKVDIPAVMKNKAQDVVLQANDLIIVPNSKGKSIVNAMLKALGMGAAQRGVYRY